MAIAPRPALSPQDQETIAYLRSPQAIRDRCTSLFDLACQHQLPYFRCDMGQLAPTADYVLSVMRHNYPDLNVPFHSRWRHFEVGGIPRLRHLQDQIGSIPPVEWAGIQIDLVVVSVLLDAGAGNQWQFVEPGTGQRWARSEGLAIASYHTFLTGLFSSDPDFPYQVDSVGLQQLTQERLEAAFQVSSANPLVGIEGRLALMHRLGAVLEQQPQLFGNDRPRPGHLVHAAMACAAEGQLPAEAVFQLVLQGFGEIWPQRVAIAGINLGDVWPHPSLPTQPLGANLVPFHKLSQWLTYSLLEPLQTLGLIITGLDTLTGLAEYRNGGLCLDLGLLQPVHPTVLSDRHLPSSPVIVEWRALTVILLDHIAATIRQTLNLDATHLPLVKILEGGTWAAGRRIAAERRPGGTPPLPIESDGTVF